MFYLTDTFTVISSTSIEEGEYLASAEMEEGVDVAEMLALMQITVDKTINLLAFFRYGPPNFIN